MRRILVVPDVHAPYHDPKAFDGLLRYAADHEWDELVQIGDFVDNRALSSHIKDKLRLREGLRFQRDQELAKELFDNLAKAVRSKKPARVTVCKGNHESWADQFLDRHPELEGALRPDEVFSAANKVFPYHKWRIAYKTGKLHYIHGYGRGGNSQVRSYLNAFNVNLVCGHLHRMEQVSKPSAHGTMSAWCVGYLGRRDLGDEYVEGPTQWQQGFAVAHVHPKNGYFHLYPVSMMPKGFTSPEGKFYKL